MSGETERDVSGWTIDTLHMHVVTHINALRDLLDERYATQTKAVDAALSAQQTALNAAAAASIRALDERTASLDREFHEHMEHYRHEVAAAMEAADRAIIKAEVANEKRFESVNEFRGQLNDQAASFLPRTEYDANHQALISKVEDGAKRNQEQFTEVNRRLDLSQGNRAGASQLWAVLIGLVGLLLAILGIVSYFNS